MSQESEERKSFTICTDNCRPFQVADHIEAQPELSRYSAQATEYDGESCPINFPLTTRKRAQEIRAILEHSENC